MLKSFFLQLFQLVVSYHLFQFPINIIVTLLLSNFNSKLKSEHEPISAIPKSTNNTLSLLLLL